MSERTEINVVAFDLDDTLYEHRQYVTAGFEAAAAEVESRTGMDIFDDLMSAYFEDEEYHQTLDVVLKSHGLSTEMIDELVAEYHSNVGSLSLYSEVPSMLEDLRGEYGLGLITDGQNAAAKLDALDLSEQFEFVLPTAHRDFSKQDPVPFRRLLEYFETEPDRAAYVGNDPRVDFREPNRLGMHTVRLQRGTLASMQPPDPDSAPDQVIEKLDTLADMLRTLTE
jgi:putative hydrolase of the HAD superfamily